MATKFNKFRCNEDCFYDNRRWTPTDKKLMYSEKEEVPHFVNISKLEKKDKKHVEEDDRLAQIKDFLASMDKNDDEMWTKDGLPQVRVVEENVGFDTNRGEISKAFSGFTRESEISTVGNTAPDFLQ